MVVLPLGSILSYDDAPLKIDKTTEVMSPFSLKQWLDGNKEKIEGAGSTELFPGGPKGAFVSIVCKY